MNINVFKVEKLLAARLITKAELAKKANLSRQSISAITCRGSCTPISAGKIAKALGVDVSEILEDSEGG